MNIQRGSGYPTGMPLKAVTSCKIILQTASSSALNSNKADFYSTTTLFNPLHHSLHKL
jgi:hypothetical protein